MATAHKTDERQEYWRPPTDSAGQFQRPVSTRLESCPECGADLVTGSRFCHVCGMPRNEAAEQRRQITLPAWLDVTRLRDAIGLPMAAMIALFAGVACVVMALLTGLMYSSDTVLDWQALQVWRIEWLLAAAAAFLAGILLKERKA